MHVYITIWLDNTPMIHCLYTLSFPHFFILPIKPISRDRLGTDQNHEPKTCIVWVQYHLTTQCRKMKQVGQVHWCHPVKLINSYPVPSIWVSVSPFPSVVRGFDPHISQGRGPNLRTQKKNYCWQYSSRYVPNILMTRLIMLHAFVSHLPWPILGYKTHALLNF